MLMTRPWVEASLYSGLVQTYLQTEAVNMHTKQRIDAVNE